MSEEKDSSKKIERAKRVFYLNRILAFEDEEVKEIMLYLFYKEGEHSARIECLEKELDLLLGRIDRQSIYCHNNDPKAT